MKCKIKVDPNIYGAQPFNMEDAYSPDDPMVFHSPEAAAEHLILTVGSGTNGTYSSDATPYMCGHGQYAPTSYQVVSAKSGRSNREIRDACNAFMLDAAFIPASC